MSEPDYNKASIALAWSENKNEARNRALELLNATPNEELRESIEQWREDAENMRTELGEDPNEDQFKWGYQSAIVNKANELEEVLDGE